jgi:hypothetical protein
VALLGTDRVSLARLAWPVQDQCPALLGPGHRDCVVGGLELVGDMELGHIRPEVSKPATWRANGYPHVNLLAWAKPNVVQNPRGRRRDDCIVATGRPGETDRGHSPDRSVPGELDRFDYDSAAAVIADVNEDRRMC